MGFNSGFKGLKLNELKYNIAFLLLYGFMPEVSCRAEVSHFPDTVQGIGYWMGGTNDKIGKDHTCIETSNPKCEGKKTPGRPRCTCENNIKIHFRVVKSDMLSGSI